MAVTLANVTIDGPLYQVPATQTDAMFARLAKPAATEVTSGQVGGGGAFDQIMRGMGAHLQQEYEKSRITGADYTKAYIELTQAALSAALQFVLGRDQAFWQAQTAQVSAVKGKVELETQRVAYAAARFNLDEILPAQRDLTVAQAERQESETEASRYTVSDILPAQKALTVAQTSVAEYQVDTLLPAQKQLVDEQKEAQRAQTHNNRSDGSAVNGVLGKQRDLYGQQMDSYKRSDEVKAAKIFADAWITQKTVDEGLVAPTNFNNATLDVVLSKLRTNLGLT